MTDHGLPGVRCRAQSRFSSKTCHASKTCYNRDVFARIKSIFSAFWPPSLLTSSLLVLVSEQSDKDNSLRKETNDQYFCWQPQLQNDAG